MHTPGLAKARPSGMTAGRPAPGSGLAAFPSTLSYAPDDDYLAGAVDTGVSQGDVTLAAVHRHSGTGLTWQAPFSMNAGQPLRGGFVCLLALMVAARETPASFKARRHRAEDYLTVS